MKYTLLARLVSVISVLCLMGCSTGSDMMREVYHLNPEFDSPYPRYEPTAQVTPLAADEEKTKKGCSLLKRFRQKDVYVYEPEDSVVTWRLKAKFDVDYFSQEVEMKHVMVRFEMPLGGVKTRPHDSKRKCRSLQSHGGYIGAFIPSADVDEDPFSEFQN